MLAFTAAAPLGVRPLLLLAQQPSRPCHRRVAVRRTIISRAEADASSPEASAMTAAAATFILKRAAAAYTTTRVARPAPSVVASALLQLEKQQKKNRMHSDLNALYGQWRLVFTSDPRSKNPFTKALYFPIRAHQTFLPGDGVPDVFDNGVFLPGFSLRLRGPMRWVADRNRLEFTVDEGVIRVAGQVLWNGRGLDKEGPSLEGRTAKTLPFFTFFAIRGDIAAARGRSGGLALYARVAEGEEL